jgi:hypothetical protein
MGCLTLALDTYFIYCMLDPTVGSNLPNTFMLHILKWLIIDLTAKYWPLHTPNQQPASCQYNPIPITIKYR